LILTQDCLVDWRQLVEIVCTSRHKSLASFTSLLTTILTRNSDIWQLKLRFAVIALQASCLATTLADVL
jgi:hypothetical protein